MAATKLWNELPSDIRDLNSVKKFKTQSRLIFLDKLFYRVRFAFFISLFYIFRFTFTFVFLYICIKIIIFCNAQLKIYIDNCAIEITKIILKIIIKNY